MSVEDGDRPPYPTTKISSDSELLNALSNGGNTPEKRRSAIRAIIENNLSAEVMGQLDRAVQAGWRKLGEPKPGEQLETADLFRTPQQK